MTRVTVFVLFGPLAIGGTDITILLFHTERFRVRDGQRQAWNDNGHQSRSSDFRVTD